MLSPAGELLARCTFPSPGTAVVCAVSGGPDSLALLVLAVEASLDVTAVHVDHGLRQGSELEAQVVAAAADRLGARFRSERVSVAKGPNLEARARAARRSVLPGDAATGHTMDDQAETVLLNMLRGAGRDGLSAMRPGPSHPLLALRRAETHELCRVVGLEPVLDPTNNDRRFVRNRIRHELLPLCSDIAGRDVVPVLARQAGVLAAEARYLDDQASALDASDAAALAQAPEVLARHAARTLVAQSAPFAPGLAAVQRVLEVARGTVRATDVAPGLRVSRSSGRLSVARIDSDAVR